MAGYVFEFDLEENKISKKTVPYYAVRYYATEKGILVEIGDGYRHEIRLKGKYWDRILKIVRNNELDDSGIKALIRGLMNTGVPKDYEDNFLMAIKKGKTRPTEEFV